MEKEPWDVALVQMKSEKELWKCPVCDFDYNHIVGSFVEKRKYASGGTHTLKFHCESGHDYELCFYEHEGQVLKFYTYEKETKNTLY